MARLDDTRLRARAQRLRGRAASSRDLDSLLVESFALTREAARRTIGMRHYDIQLVGGIILHQGRVAEMATGEGKTLVASLPIVLHALRGRGVHLVTANEYLARRDAGWMGPLYHTLGLTVGVVVGIPTLPGSTYVFDPDYRDDGHPDPRLQHLRPAERGQAYACDITYGTHSEFGFDYVRDNTAKALGQRTQRDLYYAIVDEVDSILIDEARTPHDITGQADESTDKYYEYARYAAALREGVDYSVEPRFWSATLTDTGIATMHRLTGIRNIYALEHLLEAEQINQALKAKTLYRRGQHYTVQHGEVVIVDESTGRTRPERRWSGGLHQAIEAKEGVRVQPRLVSLGTIMPQNYFRSYERLAGMTGTAVDATDELRKLYGLHVVQVPTHQPVRRIDHPDVIYKTVESKHAAVVEEVTAIRAAGRPVLVGSTTVDKSLRLSELLDQHGIPHNVLNAVDHERDAAVAANAGQPRAVTVITNMASRGTDIVLGAGVADAGGLHVIGTERHASRRVDYQLRGRAGRQGDPGSTRYYLSLEDDLMAHFGPAPVRRIRGLMDRLDVEPIESRWVSSTIEGMQKKIEDIDVAARKRSVDYDDVMSEQRGTIYRERRKVLTDADTRSNVLSYARGLIEQGVEAHCEGGRRSRWDIDGLVAYLRRYFPLAEGETVPDETVARGRRAVVDLLYEAAERAYTAKEREVGDAGQYRLVERWVMLETIDQKWVQYLATLEAFREGISWQSYGQRDPLAEYRNQAFHMFTELTESIRADIVTRMFHLRFVREDEPASQAEAGSLPAPTSVPRLGRDRPHIDFQHELLVPAVTTEPIRRNSPCWCGSGRTFKRCHGRGRPASTTLLSVGGDESGP